MKNLLATIALSNVLMGCGGIVESTEETGGHSSTDSVVAPFDNKDSGEAGEDFEEAEIGIAPLAAMALPAVITISPGRICWGDSPDCDAVPEFNPPVIEWDPVHSSRAIYRIPNGGCLVRVDFDHCWAGYLSVVDVEYPRGHYQGTLTQRSCAGSTVIEIRNGNDCHPAIGMGGSGSN